MGGDNHLNSSVVHERRRSIAGRNRDRKRDRYQVSRGPSLLPGFETSVGLVVAVGPWAYRQSEGPVGRGWRTLGQADPGRRPDISPVGCGPAAAVQRVLELGLWWVAGHDPGGSSFLRQAAASQNLRSAQPFISDRWTRSGAGHKRSTGTTCRLCDPSRALSPSTVGQSNYPVLTG